MPTYTATYAGTAEEVVRQVQLVAAIAPVGATMVVPVAI